MLYSHAILVSTAGNSWNIYNDQHGIISSSRIQSGNESERATIMGRRENMQAWLQGPICTYNTHTAGDHICIIILSIKLELEW